MARNLKIGAAAAAAGVKADTLKFYERRRLIGEPGRTVGGFRLYDSEDVRRVRFIRRAQELGFSLTEVRELLELLGAGAAARRTMRARAARKLTVLEEKIRELRTLRRKLRSLLDSCPSTAERGECPILSSLYEEVPAD